MGRIISGAAGAASIGSGGGTSSTGGTFRLKAGVATAINDLMLVGPDGRAYPGENTESSTAANAALARPASRGMAQACGSPSLRW